MAHYRMQDRLPSAIVTAGGSEKKVYEGNTVYLNNGDNFELRFFNPLQEKLGIEIIFNGQKKGTGLLVLNPGQDIKLDRFLDDKSKMLFDTYQIDSNNESAVQAAAKNGIIDISFYKEKYFNQYCSGTFQSTNSNSIDYGSNISYTGKSTLDSLTTSTNIYLNESNTANLDYAQKVADTLGSGVRSKSLTETGRVEKGDTSNQNLKEIDIEFESTPFHSISYQLTPMSTKTYTTATEIRNYCPRCNYRLRKQSWEFCPKCGKKIM